MRTSTSTTNNFFFLMFETKSKQRTSFILKQWPRNMNYAFAHAENYPPMALNQV